MVSMDEFTALAVDVSGGEVSKLSADGMLLDLPVGDGTAQVPLKEMYNKLGQRPKEELRAALLEVFATLTSKSNHPVAVSGEAQSFSLMMKNDSYWGDALKEAQRVDKAARPICRPYLHGFSLGLAQTMAHGQSQQLVRRVVLNSMLSEVQVDEDRAFQMAFEALDSSTPAELAVGTTDQYKVTLLDQDAGKLFMVFFRDNLTSARMVLPRFREALTALLQCSANELLVVPYTECTILVGVCSHPLSCYLLGVHSLAEARQPAAVPNMLTSTPYMLEEKQDTPLVCWRKYPAFGLAQGFVSRDGLVQHPMPNTSAMAEVQLQQLQGGAMPPPLLEGKTQNACYHCGKAAASLMACSRCKLARYCTKECQKLDHKDHRGFCKQWAKAS